MDIVEVKETIIKWVRSCVRIEQIEGLEKSAPAIIDTLFDKTESPLVIDLAKGTLLDEMENQKQIIKQQPHEPTNS